MKARPGSGSATPTRTHKYTTLDDKPWQCFDLVADPLEQRNLVADPAARAICAELHHALRELMHTTADTGYRLAPAFDEPGSAVQAPPSDREREPHPGQSP